MKSITVAKAFASVLSVGAIATGVTFAILPDSFGSYLNRQGRILLTSDSQHWDTVKDKYNLEADNLLISDGGVDIQKGSLDVAKLKKWCNNNSSKKFTNTDDSVYWKVSAWCTEPKKIGDQIGLNKVTIDTTEPDNSKSIKNKDEEIWTNKVNEYKKLKSDDYLIKAINTNNEGDTIQANTGIEARKLREWCKFSKDKHFKHEKDKRYLTYLKWCIN